MKRLRIALLCHEDLVPAESIEDLTDAEIDEWRTEFDVRNALEELGHDVLVAGVPDDPDAIRALVRDEQPDVCFNLLTEFLGVAHYDAWATAYLELLRQPYTGCNPTGMVLARDKALSKKVLAWHGLPVPGFEVYRRGARVRAPQRVEFPLFVKALDEEASLGLSAKSVVRNLRQLRERVERIHADVGADAIAEEWIDGRELYIGVLGNERPLAFPLRELHVDNRRPGTPLVATRRVKWDVAYQRRAGVRTDFPGDLAPALVKRIRRAAVESYRALGLSGYARLDLRLRTDGSFAFLEANPNPDLTYGEDFAEGAEGAGVDYAELVQRIIRLGLRQRAGWRDAD